VPSAEAVVGPFRKRLFGLDAGDEVELKSKGIGTLKAPVVAYWKTE
jgi:hypothetical protein